MIISITNQKGGVAKTTTSINLGYCLSQLNKKVLLIDMDPQANMSKGLDIYKQENTIYDVLLGKIKVSAAIHKTKHDNLDIIPANLKLANAEIEIANEVARESILKDKLQEDNLPYDYIIFDCNPSLGLLVVNALTATDRIIIPMEAAMFSFEGIEQLVNVIMLVKKKLNTKLDILGVLLTRVDVRTNIAKEFRSQLDETFKNKVFDTIIHQNVRITESQTHKAPVNILYPTSKGASEYMDLAREVINRE